MERIIFVFAFLLSALAAFGSSLGSTVRSAIPANVQQIIHLDYRRLRQPDITIGKKGELLPRVMKECEDVLRGIGIVPEQDIEQFTAATFYTASHGLDILVIAQGHFSGTRVTARLAQENIKGEVWGGEVVYPLSGGRNMTFLDDGTMLFGDKAAIQAAREARNNTSESLKANSEISDMMALVERGTIWSVLDANGTQNMMKAILETASELEEYDAVKTKLLGSRYTLNFDRGVDFNLEVMTADPVTASTLSTILKAGILFRKMSAPPREKAALDETAVDSDNLRVVIHFKADEAQELLELPMFSAVMR